MKIDRPRGHSLLLSLPRELRDLIYQYVLSYDQGLQVEVSSPSPWTTTQMRISGRRTQHRLQKPANILEFVCKQLWDETRGLVFVANREIALYGLSYASPSSYTFNLFIDQLSTKTLRSHLRKVTVCGSPSTNVESPWPVVWKELPSFATGFRKFCEQHSQILVVLHFPKIADVDSHRWYYWVGALQKTLRGSSPLIVPASQGHFAAQLAQLHVVFASMSPLPYNLRFSIFDVYPEENVENELKYYLDMTLLSREETGALRGEARRLFDDGV